MEGNVDKILLFAFLSLFFSIFLSLFDLIATLVYTNDVPTSHVFPTILFIVCFLGSGSNTSDRSR